MEIGLAELLRVAWIAGTLPLIVASMPFSQLNYFYQYLSGFAKRGKTMQSSAHNFTLPQKFFCHFYALAVVWTTFLIVVTWFYAYKMAPLVPEPLQYSTLTSYLAGSSHALYFQESGPSAVKERYRAWRSVFLLLLMEFQVLRRLLESIYMFKYNPSARMHFFGYVTGLLFYIAAPLSLCCAFLPEALVLAMSQMADLLAKGKNQIPETAFDWWGFVSPFLRLKWYSWSGMAIFFWGWTHQWNCHAILGSLRDDPEQVDAYVIPHGDWFDYVSSPHYLAEIVIYAGLVVASGGSDFTIWLLFLFVVANLVFAAAETQRWYLHKFDNYPRDRLAIFPFVY